MHLEVPGDPIPQPRHRHFTRSGFVKTYDPAQKNKEHFKNELKCAIFQKKKEAVPLPLVPKNIAIEAKITYFLPYSKSAAQWPIEQHTKKPDLDNLLKFTLDACKDILFHDDAQILAISASKCYSSKPRTEIFFMEINWSDPDPKLKKILEEFSPEDAHSLHCLTSQLDALCFQIDQDFDPEARTQTAALLIKKIADNYAKKLAKIQKIIDKFD